MPTDILDRDDQGNIIDFNQSALDTLSDEEFNAVLQDGDLEGHIERGGTYLLDQDGEELGEDPEPAPDPDWVRTAEEAKIPREWIVDPDTNEPYANGLIRGKYQDPLQAFRGELHKRGVLHGDGLGPHADDAPEPLNADTIQRRIEDKHHTVEQIAQETTAVRSLALKLAGEDMAAVFAAEGIPIPETEEAIEELESAYPGIYKMFEEKRAFHTAAGAQWLEENRYYSQHAEELNSSVADTAYDSFLHTVEEHTGVQADEGDQAIIREHYDGLLSRINNWAAQNPNDPRLELFADVHAGVPVLNPEKVASFITANSTDFLMRAVRESADARRRAATDDTVREARRFPPSLATHQGDGMTGGSTGLMSYEELMQSDAIDRLEQALGDPELAMMEFNRQCEYYDRLQTTGQRNLAPRY